METNPTPAMPAELWDIIRKCVGAVSADGSQFGFACNAIRAGILAAYPTPQPSDVGEVERLLYEYHRQDDMHAFYRCRICKTQQGMPCERWCPVPAVLAAVRTLAGEVKEAKDIAQSNYAVAESNMAGWQKALAQIAELDAWIESLTKDSDELESRNQAALAKHGIVIPMQERGEEDQTQMEWVLDHLTKQLTDAQARESRMREELERYGRHDNGGDGTNECASIRSHDDSDCTCGLATALAGAGEAKG